MKPSLCPGITQRVHHVVDRDRTIDFMGEALRVYATPALVRDIELACRALLLDHADAGEDSVGVRVELDHLAATPLGMTVEIAATVASVEGRRVLFDVTARDEVEEIARGRHARFIVDVARTRERLAAKTAKAATR